MAAVSEEDSARHRIASATAEAVSRVVGPDPADPVQAGALAALGKAASGYLDALTAVQFESVPPIHARIALAYSHRAAAAFAEVHHLLKPTGLVHAFSGLSSLIIRTAADTFARVLEIATATDRDAELREQTARFIGQEVRALEAAESAGVDVRVLLAGHRAMAGQFSTQGVRVNVSQVLEDAEEFEVLTAFRWESAHVHFGAAALAQATRSFSGDAVTIDIGAAPVQQWRLGQLTWAAYGVITKLLFSSAKLAGIDTTWLRSVDSEVRGTIRQTALREPRDGEDANSPPYGKMEFAL